MVGLIVELIEVITTKVPHLKNVMLKVGGYQIGYFIRDVNGLFYLHIVDNLNEFNSFDSKLLRELADELELENQRIEHD